ncbi:uncharacterized protein LOC144628205 [Oculina patagonica]
MSNIDKATCDFCDRRYACISSDEGVAQMYNVDMLQMQFACLRTNGSADNSADHDRSNSLLDNVPDATTQDLNSFSEATEVKHADSTGSVKLPSPPADSPDKGNCDPVSAVSTGVVDSISSKSSSSLKSFLWSSADSDLPSWNLRDDEEKLIWPLQDEFSVTDKFDENDQYVIISNTGRGAFGKCFYAKQVPADDAASEGREFCVKMCQYRYNELLALQLAKKDNIAEIVEFYGAKIKGINAYIFMELMTGGTIADLIQEIKGSGNAHWPIISETDSLGFLEDVLKAVKFLHSKGIVHRDIKGANVLLDRPRLRAKLTDFGSAESCNDASFSIDIWKIACLLLEMLNGERPPLFIDEGSLQRQNSCKLEDNIPSGAMEVTRELLRLCFGLKTRDRNYLPSAAEVLIYSGAFPVVELLKRLPKLSGEQLLSSENPS